MSLDKFYELIQSSQAELSEVLKDLDKFYYEKVELKIDRKTGLPKLKNGNPQFRRIRPSRGALRRIQDALKNNILNKINMPEYVQGSVKGKSNITNAAKHFGNRYFFLTDLKNFFPSITHSAVYKTFCARGFLPEVSSLIAKLTTYKGTVPQGIPTSSSIANIVFLPIDKKILSLLPENIITYTRYVDDLTFSSKGDFKELVQPILEMIEKNGFKYSNKKTNYKAKDPYITGIKLEKKRMTVAGSLKSQIADQNLPENRRKAIEDYISRVERFWKNTPKPEIQ